MYASKKKTRSNSLPSIHLRSKSAPPTTTAGRQQLTTRKSNKSLNKSTNKRKYYGIGNDCNDAPNAEYTVKRRGYIFTRHNNKFTMGITSNIFFGEQTEPVDCPFPNYGVAMKREEPFPIAQNPRKLSSKTSYAELQKKLKESIEMEEKLRQSLIEATINLEEQQHEEKEQQIKMVELHEANVKALFEADEKKKKELIARHKQKISELETQYTSKLADHQTHVKNKEMLLQEEILEKEKIINQNRKKYEMDMIHAVEAKEEELQMLHKKAIDTLTTEMISDMKLQQSTRIKGIEKEYEQIILDKADKHQKEINNLLSRFQDSEKIEEDLRKSIKLLKDAEIKKEELLAEKKCLTTKLRACKIEFYEKNEELREHKREFQAKVDDVIDQHGNIINELTIEVTNLRKMLMKKTQEHTDMMIEEERRQTKSLYSIKKVVLPSHPRSPKRAGDKEGGTLSDKSDNQQQKKKEKHFNL